MSTLEMVVRELPPELQQEVIDFARFLLETRVRRSQPARFVPSFSWAGALKDLRDQYTSVELQHAVSRWRIGEE